MGREKVTNTARVDERWDPSATSQVPNPYLETNRILEAVLPTVERQWRQPEVLKFEFLGEEIAWTRDGARPFPKQVFHALEEIARFSELPGGWDSYNGKALDRAAVRPVLELLFETHQRCRTPRLVPLSGGGVGLRWKSEAFELEVDIWSSANIEAILTDLQTDEDIEIDATSIAEVRPLLDQFYTRP